MSIFSEKVTQFEAKEAEIKTLTEEFKKAEDSLIEEFSKRQNAMKHEFETKIAEAKLPVTKAIEKYKAEQKAFFGVATGETVDLLTTVKMIRKVSELE
jgi:hypothetical protein